jgi:hypothetical protein
VYLPHPSMPAPPPEAIQRLAERLGSRLTLDFGGASFPNPEGWISRGVAVRTFRSAVAVASFALGEKTLCFIVTLTNPAEPAYKRSRQYDIVYFSEDVPDNEQSRIYARDRRMIDRFATWLIARDRAGDT